MKLRNLNDGSPVVDFPSDQWADYDTLLHRLVDDFGCTRYTDPLSAQHCWLVRDGMRLEAGGNRESGWRLYASEPRAQDFLRVVIGTVLKESEDRQRDAIRAATRQFH